MLWSSLPGSASSLVLARHLANKEGLILTLQESEAEALAKEMAYFSPDLSERIVYLQDSETLPFDLERSSASIMSLRAVGLSKLFSGAIDKPIVISCVRNAMRLFAGASFWEQSLRLEVGQPLPEQLLLQLNAWGYTSAFRTKSPGQYSRRGQVLDIFPVGGPLHADGMVHGALRIRLDDSAMISRIKTLDPLTQDSAGNHEAALIFPMRDYPLDKSAIEGFRRHAFDAHPDPRATEVYKSISQGEDNPELAWWISVTDTGASSLFSLLKKPELILMPGANKAVDEFSALIINRHAEVRKDATRIVPDVSSAFLLAADIRARMALLNVIEVIEHEAKGSHDFGYLPSGMKRRASLNDSLKELNDVIQSGGDSLFVIKSQVREKHMMVMSSMIGHQVIPVGSFEEFVSQSAAPSENPRLFLCRGDLSQGHAHADQHYRLITEREIFGSVIESRLDDEISDHQRRIILQGLHEIEVGEPLVHAMFGVGRFAGFERINMLMQAGMEEDVVKIGYADNAMAFVRIRDLDLVSRYSGGSPEKAPLSKMNDASWLAGIKEAQNSAFAVASDLVAIRAQREKATGIELKRGDIRYDRFCEVFIYEETVDQLRAIEDIMSDLTSGKPMDRLVCGDVGFGKTEVAMRAAFLTASQGYQVAVLAPTTILAEQHYHSFISRFEETNIKIALANRNTLSKADLEDIRQGKVSIVIGTHRLLQDDVVFSNLGLIVVDEEHRFGVKQKEMLRALRGNKHMLTLTATPIPRTLGMAISGIRDLSILATPPASRQSVRTIVKEFSDASLVLAMTRELSRNGQIFYLHNLIETMDACVEHIQKLMPTARIGKIHGRMSDLEMARVMMAFRRHEFDILVSTTVIEIGIDVPNANTLIVEDADNLGLAQLHQLRGRVGRSSRQAYAYLLHDKESSKTGMLRLRAMEKASNLGEGVMIARHDMEIRGIGEILGEEQSGHVHNIGFALYMRLLEQAVKSLESNNRASAGIMLTSVEMPLEGQIPSLFIEEVGERLAWYQRLMSSESNEELDEHIVELEDLYGYLPAEVEQLRKSIQVHILLREWGIKKAEQHDHALLVTLHDDAPMETLMMLKLMFRGSEITGRKQQIVLNHSSLDALLVSLAANKRR